MRVLLGTTNPSKAARFKNLLRDYAITFFTLKDLNIADEPEEYGQTPEENAVIKAKFYGQYFDKVICNDSGLYFRDIPLDDPRQPGLHIKSPNGVLLSDDEAMIGYYTELVKSLGGRVSAFYLDGLAVRNGGTVYSFTDADNAYACGCFDLVDTPSEKRRAGWPLDSISINKNTGAYFVDGGNNQYDTDNENIMVGEYRHRLTDFLVKSLMLNESCLLNSKNR